jgi:hypothetical protein
MEKIISVIATTSLLMATTAMAAVVDKKAIRTADANIAEQVAIMKSDCGNTSIEVNVVWDDVKGMIKTNKDALKSDNYKGAWVLSHTGERTVSVLEAMSKICKDDADYKEELAKVTNIVVKPKAKFSDSKNAFSFDETTINIESGHRMTRSAADFIQSIKSLF